MLGAATLRSKSPVFGVIEGQIGPSHEIAWLNGKPGNRQVTLPGLHRDKPFDQFKFDAPPRSRCR